MEVLSLGTKRTNAAYNYNVKAYDQLNIRIPKGQKAIIQAIAADYGYSLAGFIIESINYNIKRLDDQRKAQQDLIRVLSLILVRKKAIQYQDFLSGITQMLDSVEQSEAKEGHIISSVDTNHNI